MIEAYQAQLRGHRRAEQWLRSRGLSTESIDAARLGFVEVPQAAEHERFRGAIVIPYFDALGRTQKLRFRYLEPGEWHKYDGEAGPDHLYGGWLTDQKYPVVCEGEFDALILRQEGFPGIGVPGVNNFKKAWRWLFEHAERVTLVFDNDADPVAAKNVAKAANRIESWIGSVTTCRKVELPAGMDITDLYLESPELLRRLMA